MNNNKAASPASRLSPKDIADTLRAIAADPCNKIMLAHVLTLGYLADLVEAGAEVAV